MNHVLYEASFEFHPALLIPIVMMIYIPLFPSILKQRIDQKQKLDEKDYHYNEKFVKCFCIGGFVWCAIFSIIVLLSQIDMYNKIVRVYKQGNYQIVEGYVENYDPMPYGGHKEESFNINGISFSYSDFSVQPGYHNAKSHGGVITGNGQHLKIGYVYYNSTKGNVIVYIEKLD
ncbi:MAG: hypothetical protein J1F42_08140 [Lachnospiraceae bacterium]|nr:hypothetical protein [Lachnospiraceae bacterium]